ERPRIVEVPEVLPPPPALGGILMEPVRSREPERRAMAELACPAAPLSKRLLAGLFDAGIRLTALSAFAGNVFWGELGTAPACTHCDRSCDDLGNPVGCLRISFHGLYRINARLASCSPEASEIRWFDPLTTFTALARAGFLSLGTCTRVGIPVESP